MNKRIACAMVLVLAAAARCAAGEEYTQPHKMVRLYGHGAWGVGNWLIREEGILPVRSQGSITAMAFGPGRVELAYCSMDEAGRSRLWLVPIDLSPEAAKRTRLDAPSRLLWTAPEGVSLQGPLRWAPDGARIVARAVTEDNSDLVCIDYVSGRAEMLTQGADVLDAVWSPSGGQIAYVTGRNAERNPWLQAVPPAEPRRIGRGGFNVRWSVEGKLTWLRPDSDQSWTELLWMSGMAEPAEIGQRPARRPDAEWSPDGTLCAALEPIGEGEEKQLVIYPSDSEHGEVIATPEAHPRQLLGWSPDSNLILLLAEDDHLLGASAHPAAPQLIRVMDTLESSASGDALMSRVSLLAWPMIDPEAGRPAWSSDSELLAYACADEAHMRKQYPAWYWSTPWPELVVEWFKRDYTKPSELTGNPELEELVGNMRNVGLALQMNLADHGDVFPPVSDAEGLVRVLDEYVRTRSVFMRPGSEDEVVLRYVLPPAIHLADLGQGEVGQDRVPVAIADYHPDLFVIAFGDGHVEHFERQGKDGQKIERWWAEFDERRSVNPEALPPPFE